MQSLSAHGRPAGSQMARPVLGPASDVIRFDNPLSKAVSHSSCSQNARKRLPDKKDGSKPKFVLISAGSSGNRLQLIPHSESSSPCGGLLPGTPGAKAQEFRGCELYSLYFCHILMLFKFFGFFLCKVGSGPWSRSACFALPSIEQWAGNILGTKGWWVQTPTLLSIT